MSVPGSTYCMTSNGKLRHDVVAAEGGGERWRAVSKSGGCGRAPQAIPQRRPSQQNLKITCQARCLRGCLAVVTMVVAFRRERKVVVGFLAMRARRGPSLRTCGSTLTSRLTAARQQRTLLASQRAAFSRIISWMGMDGYYDGLGNIAEYCSCDELPW
jgi:hypothetical protein